MIDYCPVYLAESHLPLGLPSYSHQRDLSEKQTWSSLSGLNLPRSSYVIYDKIQIPFPGLKGLSWLSLTHHHPLPSRCTVRTCELTPGDHRNGLCSPWLWDICFLLLLVLKHSDHPLPSVSCRVLQAWLRTAVPSGLMRLKWNYPETCPGNSKGESISLPFPASFFLIFNFIFCFLAVLHSMWDLNSPAGDQTHIPCIWSMES